jgi:AcrR family transcriptional regulator
MAEPTLAPMIGRALAGDLSVSEHETDQRIMDAVVAELLVTPIRKLAVEDVAGRAGVTRMTIYRRFGDRDGLIESTIVRDVARFLDEVAPAFERGETPTERVAEGFAAALILTHGHPLVAHWLETNPGELLYNFLADDALAIQAGGAFIASRIKEMGGASRAADADRTGELLVRLFVGLVLIPPKSTDLSDPEQARRLAREVIAPLMIDEEVTA